MLRAPQLNDCCVHYGDPDPNPYAKHSESKFRGAYRALKIRSGRKLAMESCRPSRGKPGPKPKGHRTATIVYLPTELRRQAAEIANDKDGR